MPKRREAITEVRADELRLLGNDVAVIPIEDPDKTPSGLLYVPDEAKQRADNGVVKYRGPDAEEVRVGDHVFFSGYSGTKITVLGVGPLLILPEDDIVAILPDEVSHWLTRKTALDLVEQARGEIVRVKVNNSKDVRYVFDYIRTKIENYDYEKGFEF